jgi:DNA-binding NarL/FixJ family response regulator
MKKKERIKVLIVDDHQMFLEGLTALLQDIDAIYITGTATDGNEALVALENKSVDVVIMDISMPGMDGIELNNQIKKRYPKVKTLILSTHSDSKMIERLIKDNANGYLLKNAEKNELLEAIYSLGRDENYFSEEVKEKYMNSRFSQKSEQDIDPQLSKREIEIMKFIVAEYTTQEIADKLFISQHTVNSHRKNLLSKLGLKNIAGIVKYALENKIV